MTNNLSNLPVWFQQTFDLNQHFSIWQLIWRIGVSGLLGGVVSLLYRSTHRTEPITPTFPRTLVLLAILIAMVTQVIGDNVARAFSLVGALSIVRFRTVVRDTQDTAFVIFSVILGMAVGSDHLLVALVGLGIVAIAIKLLQPGPTAAGWSPEECVLSVRVAIGSKPEELLREVFARHIERSEIISAGTTKQGVALEISYRVMLRPTSEPLRLVEELNRVEGVQNIELRRGEE